MMRPTGLAGHETVRGRPNGKHATAVAVAGGHAPAHGAAAVTTTVTLDGRSVTPVALWESARTALDPAKSLTIEYSDEAIESIERATALLDKLVAAAEPVYGV